MSDVHVTEKVQEIIRDANKKKVPVLIGINGELENVKKDLSKESEINKELGFNIYKLKVTMSDLQNLTENEDIDYIEYSNPDASPQPL